MTSSNCIKLEWQVGWHKDSTTLAQEFVPASVPGAVQLDWATAQNWPEYWKANEYERFAWMEDVWWTYQTILPQQKLLNGQIPVIVFEGVDYEWSVWLNDEICLHQQEGLYQSARIELPFTAFDGKTALKVRIAPCPKSSPEAVGRDQANSCCKPAVSYGWDFHPRLIPLGIWKPVRLEILNAAHIIDAEPLYALSEKLDQATVTLNVETSATALGGQAVWTIRDPNGQTIVEKTFRLGQECPSAIINQPELWWPNGYGEAKLYSSSLRLKDEMSTPSIEHKIGFRTIRLIPHPTAWVEPSMFPKGPSNPPITLEVNNEPIFAKGTNLVGPEIFPGTVTRERWQGLLRHAYEANFNLLRLWGGAHTPGEAFFNLCDELGLLVWVEFPLACNNYPDDSQYLEILNQESRALIRLLRHRASVALWCGGNELFNAWSRMTPQSHALRLLDSNCFELDRKRPFLPTSPIMGMGHGHYTFKDMRFGLEAWSIFQNADCTAYTEYGVPAASPEHVLRSFIPDDELFPPKEGTTWETHHAFNVLMPESHLLLNVIEHYFGPTPDLTTLCERSHWLQSEGLRGLYEEARRQKPTASMALNWCFNEPWPCAANCSIVAWPLEPKPALKTVGQACRPTLVSARIEKFQWTAGELFAAELWLLHDKLEALPSGNIEAIIRIDGTEHRILSWQHEGTKKMTNLQGPRLQWILPRVATSHFELILRSTTEPEQNSTYKLAYKTPSGVFQKANTAPNLNV